MLTMLSTNVSPLSLYQFFDFDFWVEQGARYSFLTFSTDDAIGRINDNLALFTSNGDNGFAELPKEDGGMIMPIIYIDAFIQERKLDILPGGFNQTVIEWNPSLHYNVLTTNASRIFEVIPGTDAVVMNVYAYNHGDPSREPEARYYDVIRESRKGDVLTLDDEGDTEVEAVDVQSEILNSISTSIRSTGALGFAVKALSSCFVLFFEIL